MIRTWHRRVAWVALVGLVTSVCAAPLCFCPCCHAESLESLASTPDAAPSCCDGAVAGDAASGDAATSHNVAPEHPSISACTCASRPREVPEAVTTTTPSLHSQDLVFVDASEMPNSVLTPLARPVWEQALTADTELAPPPAFIVNCSLLQ